METEPKPVRLRPHENLKSHIGWFSYDPSTLALTVNFARSPTEAYVYSRVPLSVVVGTFLCPEGGSVGAAFDALVKKGGYAYEKMLLASEEAPSEEQA